jgi:hypothetical protein
MGKQGAECEEVEMSDWRREKRGKKTELWWPSVQFNAGSFVSAELPTGVLVPNSKRSLSTLRKANSTQQNSASSKTLNGRFISALLAGKGGYLSVEIRSFGLTLAFKSGATEQTRGAL